MFPSPGKVTQLSRPGGPGIRLDSGVYLGWTVPLDYDPLLAKLAVWALTREEAIARMLRALDEYTVDGIKTTLGFYRRIFADQAFPQGCLHTGFIDEFLGRSGTGLWPVAGVSTFQDSRGGFRVGQAVSPARRALDHGQPSRTLASTARTGFHSM